MRYTPFSFKGLQGATLSCFSSIEKCRNLGIELQKKWFVTLDKLELPVIPLSWFDGISSLLDVTPIFHRMCWLKTIAGAWCTSVRLSTYEGRGCCFGCIDTRDELVHYLQCPILWHFACAALSEHEFSICIFERLGILNPTLPKLRLLAFCHALYHSVINDPVCVNADGQFAVSVIVQRRASESCKYCLHLVGVGQ